MAKVNFNKLKLSKDTEVVNLNINGIDIEVKKYLPLEDKESIVQIATQNSIEFNFINPMKMEMYLHLFVIYKYTNISFTDKQRENEYDLYDILESSGTIEKVIDIIYDDYEILRNYCEEFIVKFEQYKNSAYGIVSTIIGDIPESIGEALSALEGLDLTKLSEVMQTVSTIGGNESAISEEILGHK